MRVWTSDPVGFSELMADVMGGRDPLPKTMAVRLRSLLNHPAIEMAHLNQPKSGGYERTCLFACPDGRFSVWGIVWSPQSATPIHSHHCWCVVGLVQGQIVEVGYEPVSECQARRVWERVYKPGMTQALCPDQPNIHRMENRTGVPALSIHVYGFDPRLRPTSIERCFHEAVTRH
ncbi:MAG TPA: cysteine dioxygenase family protein [Azospirillaceae bacterium]|nr:cysteine dioxygenase family protein [Azospirillaceae bacterium]